MVQTWRSLQGPMIWQQVERLRMALIPPFFLEMRAAAEVTISGNLVAKEAIVVVVNSVIYQPAWTFRQQLSLGSGGGWP